jgi:hypothetical protein
MDNVLLISYATLTKVSELNENIDTKILTPLVAEVQKTIIRPVLGTTLYNALLIAVATDTLSADQLKLLTDYIRPALINGILTDLPFKLNYRFTNTGMTTRTSEHAKAPEYKDIQKLSDYYKAKAVRDCGELTKFLCANVDKYPEYRETTTAGDRPVKEQYDTGVYLD